MKELLLFKENTMSDLIISPIKEYTTKTFYITLVFPIKMLKNETGKVLKI
jgi:hypothetical protein